MRSAWAVLHCYMQVQSAADIENADRLVFPGVGAFGQAMDILKQRGYVEALKEYIKVPRHSHALSPYPPMPVSVMCRGTHLSKPTALSGCGVRRRTAPS